MDDQKFQLLDIILIDIISFSKLSNQKQLELLTNFNQLYKKAIRLVSGGEKMIEAFISTGDGFYILVKHQYRGSGLLLAISLKNMAEKFKREIPFFCGIRVAVHTGYLIPFSDVSGQTNYLGNGLNSCSRYADIRIDKKHPFYDNGYLIASEAALKTFNAYYKINDHLGDTLNYLGFEFSDKITITDKHGFHHHGYFVKTEKYDIIILNKKLDEDKKKILEESTSYSSPQVLKCQHKIKEYEERMELFYQELSKIRLEAQELSEQLQKLDNQMGKIQKINPDAAKTSELGSKLERAKREKIAKEKIKQEIDERLEEYQKKELEFVPVIRDLIAKEKAKIEQHKRQNKYQNKKRYSLAMIP